MFEHVSHVERPGDVRRRERKRKARAGGVVGGAVEFFLNPVTRPAQFNLGGRIDFGNLVVQSASCRIFVGTTLTQVPAGGRPTDVPGGWSASRKLSSDARINPRKWDTRYV